jgi:hypothetical protein
MNRGRSDSAENYFFFFIVRIGFGQSRQKP